MSGLVDGKAIAAEIMDRTTREAASLRERGTTPALAVVVATEDEGTAWYVRSIGRTAAKAGITCQTHRLPPPAAPADIVDLLARLSVDPAVHGIICQTPLPTGIDLAAAGSHIAVSKDIDGANPASLGMTVAGVPGAFPPATAAAVMAILQHEHIPLKGRRVVVVGRSNVVGKPVAFLLLAEHSTVTICHSRTQSLPTVCQEADVLVAAVGRPKLIGPAHVRPGAVVIDVGTNPTDSGGLVGDVDTDAVVDIAAAITPVPGGVGPVTTAQLMHHTVCAARRTAT